MRSLAVCSLALGIWLAQEQRSEAETRAAVLGVEAVDAPTDLASRISDALKARVTSAPGFKLVPGRSLEEIKLVFGCLDETPGCMARVGRTLQASKILWGSVRRVRSGYTVTVKMLDVATTSMERSLSADVEPLELSAANINGAIERLTRSFLPSRRGGLQVSVNVEGAAVLVDGRAAGTVGAGGLGVPDLALGTHDVQVKKEGYQTWRREVSVEGGQTTAVLVELLPAHGVPLVTKSEPSPPPPSSSRTGWKAAFWASAALTVGFAGGIAGLGVTVLSKQDDKNNEITAYRDRHPGENAFDKSVEDVCAKAQGNPDATGIIDACDSGRRYALLTNVAVALTATAALVAGFSYYKAYLAPDTSTETDEKPGPRDANETSWIVAPTIGPSGGGLGFNLSF